MMDSILQQKSRLRKQIKIERSKISPELFGIRCQNIRRILISFITDRNINVVHCFISMTKQFEVDTYSIIDELLKKGKKIFVPVMNENELEHSELMSINELRKNQWGVHEPLTKIFGNLDSIDIILVPLLAIDNNGNRLGYGKGYYDRFLMKTKALKIGLVFDDFVLNEIPIENHDIKLDGFITEKGIKFMKQ